MQRFRLQELNNGGFYGTKNEFVVDDTNKFITPIIITTLLIIFIVFFNPIAIVGVGERGVKVTLGKVSPTSYTEGVHFVTPFISSIKNMNVKTQKNYIDTSVYTKDIQQAQISYVLNYNLQPENAHKMYREVGSNYFDTVVSPVVEGTIKDVIGKWNAQDLVANREKATQEILVKLQKHLAPKYINVTDFQMTAIAYSGVFEKAIESKVTAEQEALRAKTKQSKSKKKRNKNLFLQKQKQNQCQLELMP